MENCESNEQEKGMVGRGGMVENNERWREWRNKGRGWKIVEE